MKTLLAILFLTLPAFAQDKPVVCNFSKEITDHRMVTAEGCSAKLCMHVIECEGGKAETATCAAKNGACDGYSADECRKSAKQVTTVASYARTTFPRVSGQKPGAGEAKPDSGGGR